MEQKQHGGKQEIEKKTVNRRNMPPNTGQRPKRPLSERELYEMRARKARKMKIMRRRRRILILGLLAVCILTGVLVAAISGAVRKRKAEKAAVETAALQESMSASVAEEESKEAEEQAAYVQSLRMWARSTALRSVKWDGAISLRIIPTAWHRQPPM